MKRYLFFFVHPSKFLLYRNTIAWLKSAGHTVDIAIVTKDVLEDLVIHEGWPYVNLFPAGRRSKSNSRFSIWFHTVYYFFLTVWKLYRLTRKKKYELFEGDCLTVTGRLRGVPSILFIDDDLDVTPANALLYRCATAIISPHCTRLGKFDSKKIPIHSYKELAYLHPDVFVPDPRIVSSFNPGNNPYVMIRLVAMTASHDAGKSGLSDDFLQEIIRILRSKYLVFISSERPLSTQFESMRMSLPPHEIAHALYAAEMFISDSQTMTSEACILGTPSIRINDFAGRISVMEEKEKRYGLTCGFRPQEREQIVRKIREWSEIPDLKEIWNKRKQTMLNEMEYPGNIITRIFATFEHFRPVNERKRRN